MNLEPKNQITLFGHKNLMNALSKMYENNKLPNKLLLSGEKGIGKSTLAYHLVNYVLSKNEEFNYDYKNFSINPENKTYKLLQNNSNPNFHLVDVANDKKIIDITQIRELIINLNKSSFNEKARFVLIDNIEFLNVNSINALLKVLEEPNDKINFILINNNKKILPTLKSRCLNFKVFLTNEQSIEIINQILNLDVKMNISNDLLNHYCTPGQIFNIVKFSAQYQIDLKNTNLLEFMMNIINTKIYKKDKSYIGTIYSFIELYFRNNISVNNISLIKQYQYFLKKINNLKVYNLDEESLFMEFKDKVLNG